MGRWDREGLLTGVGKNETTGKEGPVFWGLFFMAIRIEFNDEELETLRGVLRKRLWMLASTVGEIDVTMRGELTREAQIVEGLLVRLTPVDYGVGAETR